MGHEAATLFVLVSHPPPHLILSLEKPSLQGGTQSGFIATNDRTTSASSFTQEFPFTNFLGELNMGGESLNQESDRGPTWVLQPPPHSEAPESDLSLGEVRPLGAISEFLTSEAGHLPLQPSCEGGGGRHLGRHRAAGQTDQCVLPAANLNPGILNTRQHSYPGTSHWAPKNAGLQEPKQESGSASFASLYLQPNPTVRLLGSSGSVAGHQTRNTFHWGFSGWDNLSCVWTRPFPLLTL